MVRSFSYGGGVQSTACLVLAAQGKIDFRTFLFSNVGDDSEHPDTLRYVREVAVPYAAEHGLDLHILGRVRRDGAPETLYGRLLKKGSRSLPIPVRMSHNGAPGTRNCTADFKMRVIRKWQREHGSSVEEPAVCGIGISLDEMHRARTDSGFPDQVLEYPLLDLRIKREDCKRIIAEAGLEVPPKSACYFCPFHDLAAWRKLRRETPELAEKASALEDTLNERRKKLQKDPVYMTRYGRPLREVLDDAGAQIDFDYDGPETCDSGHCWT